jgi:hypothetical protein
MTDAFDTMGNHPFVTLFIGIVLMTIVHDITSIFKKDKNEEPEDE